MADTAAEGATRMKRALSLLSDEQPPRSILEQAKI
jgi:hypothetical protein